MSWRLWCTRLCGQRRGELGTGGICKSPSRLLLRSTSAPQPSFPFYDFYYSKHRHHYITIPMRLLASLTRLPLSLLITSFALTCSSLPVRSASLTPDNFKSTIAKGVWLIEHFSPYCPHCRAFAPTWEKLAEENEKAVDPGVRLAQVNCAVHGGM